MQTPYFPAFRARFAALGRRVHSLRQQSLLHLETLFEPFLPPGLLAQAAAGPNSRHRIYSLRRTFWGFLYQVLNRGCPCREVVRQVQAFFQLHHLGRVQGGTGGYGTARARLPLQTLQRLRRDAAAQGERMLCSANQLWRGFSPKVIDGTTLTLPDTPANQRLYPQSRSQKPGCGFPLMKLVGVFSLASGVLLDYAKGNKHQHELALLRKLLDRFGRGDLVLADRGFSSYGLIGRLLSRGVASLFRLHQARRLDGRRGRRLGKNDRLMVWSKPRQRPRYLPEALWQQVPKELRVRVFSFTLEIPGYRSRSVTLVTPLLDPKVYSRQELARLYARRWRIELWFRDIKTSLGMEALRCQSPTMVHKELEMYLIAYNLLRALIVQAGGCHEVPVERLSFKGTVDACRQYSLAIAQARSRKKRRELVADLLRAIAADPVPDRPGRREARALKRRPKPYPLLNQPRHRFKEIPHRSRYRKSQAQNATA